MHIPDGFLDAKTAIGAGVLAAAGLGTALHRVRRTVPQRQVPLIGLAGAFVFASQMINFPVLGGTSGHLIGAVLTTVLLGPSVAILVISAVLILQCFMFADGGLTALGANIFNMGLVAVAGGYAVYAPLRWLAGGKLRGCLFATAFASWCSIVFASIACAGELSLSGLVPWRTAFPTMTGVHMLIGLGEALITTLIVAGIAKVRPELLSNRTESTTSFRDTIVYGLLVCVGLALFVAPFACGWPDGLDKAAETLGFSHLASPVVKAPMSEYSMPGFKSPGVSVALAGGLGTILAFVLACLLARALAPNRATPAVESSRP